MYVKVNLSCSQCGSHQYETFQRTGINGTRCLHCGHENVRKSEATEVPGTPKWNKPTLIQWVHKGGGTF